MANELRYPKVAPISSSQDAGFSGLTGMAAGAEYPTEYIDYIKFQEVEVKYGAGGGLTSTSTSKTGTVIGKTVFLYMPSDVSISYGVQYNPVAMGATGVGAVQALGSQTASEVAQSIRGAASSAAPEAMFNTLSAGLSGLGNLVGVASQATANNLSVLSQGLAFNPFQEQVFEGLSFRAHSFNFKLVARSKEEAEDIVEIVKFFKSAMLPSLDGGPPAPAGTTAPASGTSTTGGKSGTTIAATVGAKPFSSNIQGARYLKVPNRMRVDFTRIDLTKKGSDAANDIGLYKFKDCVIDSVNVSYTPDGQYVSTLDGYVPAVNLQLSLKEVAIVTREDVQTGGY